jgi:hypothetical protein
MFVNKFTSNVFTSATFLYFYLKIFGLFPSSLKNESLKCKICGKVYSILIGFAWCSLLIYGLFNQIETEEYTSLSQFLIIVWDCATLAGYVAIFIPFIYQIWNFKNISMILELIHDFDEKARRWKVSVNFNQHKRKSLYYIFCSVFVVILMNVIPILYTVFGAIESSGNSLVSTIYFLNYFYSNAFVFQHVCATICIRDRFRAVHEKVSSKRVLNSYEVDLIIELYKSLFHSMTQMNNHMSFQLIPILAYFMLCVTFTLYALVRLFLVNSSLKYFYMLPQVVSISMHFGIITTLIYCASSAVESAERTFDVGYEIKSEMKILNTESKVQLDEFLKLIKGKQIPLRTAFFNIDWKLLFSVSYNRG